MVTEPARYRVLTQGASDQDIARAATLLFEARLPIVIAGTAVHTARAHAEFERLARVLQCPVLTTHGGLGVLPDTDPQWLPYYTPPGHKVVGQADLVLAVGTSVPETMHFGRLRHFENGDDSRQWIVIERDPAALGVNRNFDQALIGDLRTVLPQLTKALEAHGSFTPPAELEGWRAERDNLRAALEADTPRTDPINPARMMLEAREAIPDDAVIVHDGGYTLFYQLACFQRRSRDFLWSSKFAHLGTGLPYALGAQLAVGRDRPVCLITGDGSLGFHIMELETAARHSLPVVVIVNYDQLWGAEARAHVEHIGHMVEVQQAFVRLDKIAEAVGGHGELVVKNDDIGPAIERAFAAGKPAVVQVVVDPAANAIALPPYHDEFMSWLSADTPPGLVVEEDLKV